MTLSTTARGYLDRLDAALADVDPRTAADLHAGLAEELDGLDDATAQRRIAELGDPSFVAASVRAEAGAPPDVAPPNPQAAPAKRGLESTAMIAATSVLVAVGGTLIPLVGWIAGIVLMWCSPVWRNAQKLTVTLLPLAIALALGGLGMLFAPAPSDATGPLVPTSFDTWHMAVLSLFLTPVLTGAWLLVRGLRR